MSQQRTPVKASSSANQKPPPKKPPPAHTPMDTDPPDKKPEDLVADYTDYRLIAAYDPNLKNNILKFAPSSSKSINLESFVKPIKLNRKDPWAIRKKAEEEKTRAAELRMKAENGLKDEDDMKLDSDSKDAGGAANKPARDDALVAPAPASQPKVKNQPFKKKTKQVFIAADQSARMLKKEEYQSWLLEDGSTSGERWVGRFESAGAGSGPGAGSSTGSKSNTTDAPNYVVFRLNGAGEHFQVLPCHRFYRFTQRPNYDTLGADEAEAAYEKMQKPTTKEDVGRWFMRRRGAGAVSGSSSTNGAGLKREASVKPSILDESKLSFGNRTLRPQVEAVSTFHGRRGKFTAVHGSSNLAGDDDEDTKPKLGQDGDFDEFDFNEEFADDEEGAGNLNDEAMEEDELKELEERMKREMLAAGRAGDDEREKDDMDMDKDDLFGERDDLTKEGKAVKKLLMRKADNDVYDSDDDVKNPYASEEDESDFEEVVPPPAPPAAAGSPPDATTRPTSRSGTPAPTPINSSAPAPPRNVAKAPIPRTASNLKGEKPQSKPPSRAGTPTLPAPARSISSPRPANGAAHTLGGVPRSRASSPQPPVKSSHSRASSPMLPSAKSPVPVAAVGTPSGGKRKHPGGSSAKEKRLNPGSNGSAPGSPLPDQGTGLITEQEVITLLRNRTLSTKELLSHFKLRLKDARNKTAVFIIIKNVAQMIGGQLVLREGL